MPAPRRVWKKIDYLTESKDTTTVAHGLAQAATALCSEGLPVAFFESSDHLAAIVLTPDTVASAREAGVFELSSDAVSSVAGATASLVLTATSEVELRQDDLVDVVPPATVAVMVGYPRGKPGGAQHRTGRMGTLGVPAASATFDLHLVPLQTPAAVSQVRALSDKRPERPDSLTQREEWFRKRSGRRRP